MSDEPTSFLVIRPDRLEFAVNGGRVIVRLRGFEKEAGLTPGLGVMLGMSPDEARQFAAALNRTALLAESGESQQH